LTALRRVLRAVAIAAVALLASACARAEPPTPLLWKVSDGDNAVYLLGSFHLLRPTDYPLAPSVEAAFADAERVAFEISPAEMDSPELPALMLRAGTLPPGQTLQGSVDAATWTKLQAYAATRGIPVEGFASMEPWFVALLVSVTEMQRLGLDPSQGLDRQLSTRAAAAHKPASGLETAAQQVAALDSMSPTEQQQSLQESLGEAAEFQAEIESLHTLWRQGDADALYARMGKDLRDKYPQLYRRINSNRNAAWLPEVRAMLDAEKADETLVVVGSLHLLGPDGLVELLRKQGYRVERVGVR
jgi:uncharacterized protein YbaP (TraB family)